MSELFLWDYGRIDPEMPRSQEVGTRMNAKELWRYLDALNAKNDFDLAWEWDGSDDEPYIRVYEEAERHELCGGNMDDIKQNIQRALPHWGLEDVE